MSYKKDTIEIKLNSYGTLDVVCVPVKLYKDSYKVVKLRVLAPDKSGAAVKVYSTGRNVAGEQVWTSETHSVPSTNESKVFGDATYRVYETTLPQEFCLESGDLNLTFAQVVTTSGQEEIVTSGTLNLYIGGEGYNNAGEQISDYDVLASRVNQVIEQAVNKEDIAELEGKITNSASKKELQEVDDRLTGEINRVEQGFDDIKVPTKLSELENDVSFAKTTKTNTFQDLQNFYKGVHIRVARDNPSIDMGVYKAKPTGQDYTVATIKHTAINIDTYQTKESYLYFPTNSGTIALKQDVVDATTASALIEKLEDSETIVQTLSNDKLKLELNAEVQSKLARSLVTPMSRPSATELVAVDNTNSQKMIEIGDGLSLDNGVLKATGGGGDSVNAHKQILIGGEGVLESNRYHFTIENASSYMDYRTNLTKFLVDLNLAIVGDLDSSKEVAITFGDTTYYVFNILKGNEHATIGDLQQVDKYNNAIGYRFITEMTFFETSDAVGFAIIPTISMSDILALDSDQMDNYMADGGLTQGQLAVCNNVITNGYDVGALYRFDIEYPSTYSWTKLSYSKTEIDTLIGDIETLLSEV